ncbi:hypothetical protein F2Q70_00001954 [Brassica cretica]|uniref:Uncharacterized protein n=1 Tax=Brassica cretica TaxID=69181 RepID=A0A8S9ISL2_BRACR|nr:hypothetical protein F2Q70_00001954 [Brassica cretica]KAF2598389.1 hypothetical protein F2Q68_00012246 [Brassica cretica]
MPPLELMEVSQKWISLNINLESPGPGETKVENGLHGGDIPKKWEDSEFWRVCRRRKEEESSTNGTVKEMDLLRITDS